MNDPNWEHFLAACGSTGLLRLGVGERESMELTTQEFAQPFLVIGRRSDSDLVLDHWQVSRRHAYLQIIDGRYYCVDLGSRTGTHGGDATRRSGWLEPGRTIQIGPYAVRPEDLATQPREPIRPPGVTWEISGRAPWKMDRYLALVGRSPACKLRIHEPEVSKFHCSLVLTEEGVWVVDLLGEHGVYLNDRKIRCERVEDGDELRVGRHLIKARYDHAPLPLPAFQPFFKAPATTTFVDGPLPTIPFAKPPGGRNELPARLTMPPAIATGQDMATLLEQVGGTVDPSVNLLVHQFGMMQQNMLDQFHQTMMMMFEGFAALHREQASTIREEFDQVRKLSAEIEALRAETARLAKEAAAKPPEPYRSPGNGHARPYQPRPLPQLGGDPIKRASIPSPDPEVDIHAQLCLKLASIETERQNRWQKILGMMTAKS